MFRLNQSTFLAALGYISKFFPDFTLKSDKDENISLSDFIGKSEVVLYFYPKDNTPGCTKEACSFRDNIKNIHTKNAVVLGISPDSVKSHQNFIQKQSGK